MAYLRPRALTAAMIFMASLCCPGVGLADPHPACEAGATGSFPAPGTPPIIKVVRGDDLAHWTPPCHWMAESKSTLVVALTGSFRFDGPMTAIVKKIGQLSALKQVRYWSVTDKKWGPLVLDGGALLGPNPDQRRNDFEAPELVQDANLFYWENDPRFGKAVYNLRVLDKTPDAVVVGTQNVTSLRRFLFTLFKPGALQSILMIQRVSPGVVRVDILNRTTDGISSLARGHEDSYANRENALFRYLAGAKTDAEPPIAP